MWLFSAYLLCFSKGMELEQIVCLFTAWKPQSVEEIELLVSPPPGGKEWPGTENSSLSFLVNMRQLKLMNPFCPLKIPTTRKSHLQHQRYRLFLSSPSEVKKISGMVEQRIPNGFFWRISRNVIGGGMLRDWQKEENVFVISSSFLALYSRRVIWFLKADTLPHPPYLERKTFLRKQMV